MDVDFTGKIVLVTGASAGIGEATALLFAKLGAKLALVGRNEAKLLDVANRCEKEKGLKALPIVADLGTDEGVVKTVKETIEHFGRYNLIIVVEAYHIRIKCIVFLKLIRMLPT